MKKFLTILATSALFLSALIVSQGFSHQANCYEDHCHEARPTTNRVFSFNYHNSNREIERLERLLKNRVDKFTFWRNYRNQIETPANKKGYSLYKTTRSSFFPRFNNVLPQPHKIAVRETAYTQNYKWDSLKRHSSEYKKEFFAESGNGYVVKFPVDFIKTDDNRYYDAQRDLTINVSKENHLHCEGLSFQLCASKEGARSREIFENVKYLSQKFGLRQITVNGETISAPTYRESFIASTDGIEQLYFFYTTMNPFNKNVLSLDAFTPASNKFASTNIIEGIFTTIQL